MDLQALLPKLLPSAVAWAESQAAWGAQEGAALAAFEESLARRVGVTRPDLIRVALVDTLPMPKDSILQAAAVQTGLLGPNMIGLTLGYTVFICHGHNTSRLLAHEFRHVFQYERAGSIVAFLPIYLQEIVQFGYDNAPLEQDARSYENVVP